MYCPVDGDEFREGITWCPEHDVALVDELPEPADEPASLPLFDERFGMRTALFVLVIGAIGYAGFGFLQDVGLAWSYIRNENVSGLLWAQALRYAGLSLGIGGGLVLSGVLAFRAYQRLTDVVLPAAPPQIDVEETWTNRLTGRGAMRLLLGLVVLFALVWAVSGVATSFEVGRSRAGAFAFSESEQPSNTTIALFALRDGSFVCGIGSFGIMVAAVMMRAHSRLLAPAGREAVGSEDD